MAIIPFNGTGNWTAVLAMTIAHAEDGDTIVVPSESMKELGKRAAKRTGKQITFEVQAKED